MASPVSICWLKRAAHDHREYRHLPERPKVTKDKKVAIIGAGSAGIACARELAEMGYPVTIYDMYRRARRHDGRRHPRLASAARGDAAKRCDEYLDALGVEVQAQHHRRQGCPADRPAGPVRRRLHRRGLHALESADRPGQQRRCPGADLYGVVPGLPFLEKVNFGEPVFVGKRVAVLGGGFTAMDCCRSSMRFGAEKVYVLYRRSKEEMPSDEYEVDEATLEHVEFIYLCSPIEVLSNDGVHVSGLKMIRNRLGDPDAGGRRKAGARAWLRVRPRRGHGHLGVRPVRRHLVDSGAGAGPGGQPLGHPAGGPRHLDDQPAGPLRRRRLHRRFAQPDLGHRRRARRRQRDQSLPGRRQISPAEEAIEIELPDFRRGMVDDYESIPYQIIPALPLQKRFSITAEAETGYSPEEAITQARRCLQCQLNIMIDPSICILCSGCVDICPYDCISMQGLTRVVKGDPLHQLAGTTWEGGADMIIDEEKCIRCGLCIVRCPTDAISMVQFEVKSANNRWNVSKIPVVNPA